MSGGPTDIRQGVLVERDKCIASRGSGDAILQPATSLMTTGLTIKSGAKNIASLGDVVYLWAEAVDDENALAHVTWLVSPLEWRIPRCESNAKPSRATRSGPSATTKAHRSPGSRH